MTGAGKILTVSNGTFMCTLEGFDKPFVAMKAIADYFRDLAADGRYFETEQPKPDVDVLAKIAGRETNCQVNAKTVDNGVILSRFEQGSKPAVEQDELANEPIVLDSAPNFDDQTFDADQVATKSIDETIIDMADQEPENGNVSDVHLETSLSAEDEADLEAELADIVGEETAKEYINPELDREIFATLRADRANRVMHETSGGKDDASVERLLDEANVKLDAVENTRRQSEISHLRGAVAATVADEKINPFRRKTVSKLINPYRNDLADAVTPKQPNEQESVQTGGPAPLVLVTEQRSKKKTDAGEQPNEPGAPIQPRRIRSEDFGGEASTKDRRPALNIGQEKSDVTQRANSYELDTRFADFVDALGVDKTPDLIEAAAAFSTFVEGRPHFARPQIMRQVAKYLGEHNYNREECLQSFGQLMDQGMIIKIKSGLFEVAQTTRFKPEIGIASE